VAVLYTWAFIAAPDRALQAVGRSLSTAASVALIIVSVFSALGLFGVLVDKKAIGVRLSKPSGPGMLLLAAGFGTVLIGPVYAIFPLLKAFREHGARWAVIVTIMTAWAVKLPVVPLEVRFLGWQFSLVRSVLTIIAALAMGVLFERLMPGDPRLVADGDDAPRVTAQKGTEAAAEAA
jgi:uncharacterized membrane protein YraQ (UPF0718 family)